MKSDKRFGYFKAIVFLVLAVMPAQVLSQPVEQVLSLAKKEKPVLLETLKDWSPSSPAAVTTKVSTSLRI